MTVNSRRMMSDLMDAVCVATINAMGPEYYEQFEHRYASWAEEYEERHDALRRGWIEPITMDIHPRHWWRLRGKSAHFRRLIRWAMIQPDNGVDLVALDDDMLDDTATACVWCIEVARDEYLIGAATSDSSAFLEAMTLAEGLVRK